jgi:hypothetical protein
MTPAPKQTIRVALHRPTIGRARFAESRPGRVEYRRLDRADRVVVVAPRVGAFPALRLGNTGKRHRIAICNEGVSLNLLPTGPCLAGLGPSVRGVCKKRRGRGADVASTRRSSRTSACARVWRPPVERRGVVGVWSLFASRSRAPIGVPARSNPRDRYNRLSFCVDASHDRHWRSRPRFPSQLPACFDRGTARGAGG